MPGGKSNLKNYQHHVNEREYTKRCVILKINLIFLALGLYPLFLKAKNYHLVLDKE